MQLLKTDCAKGFCVHTGKRHESNRIRYGKHNALSFIIQFEVEEEEAMSLDCSKVLFVLSDLRE